MSDSEKITVTLKADGGYDAPWIVIHADSVAEAGNLLDQVEANLLTSRAAQVARSFGAQYKVTTELGGAPVQTSTYQPSQPPAPAAPANGAPYARPADAVCVHGEYVWKDFQSKKGNAIKGYFCPSQSRTDCDPKYAPRS